MTEIYFLCVVISLHAVAMALIGLGIRDAIRDLRSGE
jgi:hypothetical protein